ncbi:hypothetical protein QQP08_027834 [Theobroma cacao]|nr:hypothetical protein QQP08_027834 [Theobroma cacao]
MWYLSRTPHSAPNVRPNDLPKFTLLNSIFPVSDSGIFGEISIVEVPNDMNGDVEQNLYSCNSWEWFAYQRSPMQFHSVAVPRISSYRIQVIAVFPDHFLCAKLAPGPQPHASLFCYSIMGNVLLDMPNMQVEDHNLIATAGALMDGWPYLAGGHKGDPSSMHKPRAFATGITHNNKFYVIGGGAILKNSAEIHDPSSNSWQFLTSFVPKEANGFAVSSLKTRLLMLTWSDQLGIKLWLWIEMANPYLIGGWRLISCFPNQQIERGRLREHGARMVRVGQGLLIIAGDRHGPCQVDGMSAWPVLPPPMFMPRDGCEVVLKGYIYAFSFQSGIRINWRKISVYSI